ncbi:O-antigen ligase family protein [Paraburkholderia sp. LEh10]|uniref:O-antigen ligase family protein n=1 Tax=Paraburkholderia sp. LEh10 TaxID=2821353 RepID=UPI001AE78AB5|nr:O-antigen ligase family protein [Paraburkholderia sp. LEh10]MBP0591691.1 O-antigen ligase family protein [Paraburkholderia sp. LEh10]
MQHARRESYPLILARTFALVALFAVPLSTAGVNIAATAFAVCALLSPEVWRNWRALLTDRVSVAALLLAGVLTLSIAWTSADRVDAFDFLMKYRKLVYLPLLMLTFRDSRTTAWTTVAKWALFGALTFSLLLSCSNWLGWTSVGPWHSNTDPIRKAWVFKDHIAAGIMMALLFYLSLNFARQSRVRAAKAALYAIALLAIVNVLLMMQGRTGQVIAILFIVIYVVTYFASLRGVKPWVRWGSGIALVAVAGGLVYAALHAHGSRLAETHEEISAYETSNKNTSMGVRIVFYRRSLELIAERPIIGRGVGTVREEFDALARNNTGAAAATAGNPHNEFLLMGIQVGALGIALFVFLLVQIGRSALGLREPARTIVLAYLFAFTIGCFANSLLLNFTEGNLFIFLVGIFLSCRRGTPSTAEQRAIR